MLDPLHDSAHDGVCVWFSLCETDILRHLCAGEHINIALKNEFLPVTEPFRTEAAFILQCNANGTLDAWEIKQSIH